jgi:DNA-binding response OmpR family regulator
LLKKALSEGGVETVIAETAIPTGEEAVSLLNGHKGKYRALVTDINLRGKMEGWEVVQHAREIEADFPVIYMSGQSADEWTVKGVPNSIMFAKPFAPAQLVTALSNLNSGTPTNVK